MQPSLDYIFHKIAAAIPSARFASQNSSRFNFKWVSSAAADVIGKDGFLYFVEPGVSVSDPNREHGLFACVILESSDDGFLGIPRVIVPDGTDMPSLFDYVVDELDKFRLWDKAVSEILIGKPSLDELLGATHSLISRPMYFADIYWRMIARIDSDMDEMSSYWLHEVRHGCLPIETTELLNSSGEYRSVVGQSHAQLVKTAAFNMNYIAKAIKYRGRTLMLLFVIDTWNDLGPCEIEVVDKLGDLLGPVLGKTSGGGAEEFTSERSLASTLGEDHVSDRQLASVLSTAAGWRIEGDFRLAAVKVSEYESASPLARMRVESVLSDHMDSCIIPDGEFTFAAYRNSGADDDKLIDHLKSCAVSLERSVLLSGRFSNFSTASSYFRRFKEALASEELLDDQGAAEIIPYERMLYGDLARWCQAKLPPVYELEKLNLYDSRHRTDLARTLYLYLVLERNAAATAEAMQLHRNSMHARIQRIHEVIDVDLDDPSVRLRLFLALNEQMGADRNGWVPKGNY